MFENIKEKIKAWLRWVYDWVTVLTATLIGAPAIVIDFATFVLGQVDIVPFVGTDTAAKIITGVAIAKAVAAFIESRYFPKDV
jgi:hypothetical protein